MMISLSCMSSRSIRITILLVYCFQCYSWHAYKTPPTIQNSTICEKIIQNHASSTLAKMRSQYNLWPIGDIVSENNKGILFGMNEAFERIWKHQHPVNCSTSKFLISGFEKSFF